MLVTPAAASRLPVGCPAGVKRSHLGS